MQKRLANRNWAVKALVSRRSYHESTIKESMKSILIASLLSLSTVIAAAADKDNILTKVIDIKRFGAVGDGVAMETKAIQDSIDACHEAGGGVVRVPTGDFQIGTIELKSSVTLSLDYGANLLGSTNKADYRTEGIDDPREGGPHCLIYANGATNITIDGLGVIDGRGTPEHFPRLRTGGRNRGLRPRLLRMVNCDGLTLSGVTWKRPAFWGLHLIDCKNIHFDAVTIRFRNNNFNNDGLDLDGCENVLIQNCDIDSGDDAICLKSSKNICRNIVVRGCKVPTISERNSPALNAPIYSGKTGNRNTCFSPITAAGRQDSISRLRIGSRAKRKSHEDEITYAVEMSRHFDAARYRDG